MSRHRGKSATAFRTISEVSDELEVPQHVLRFWETKFSQVRPMKRGGGRRYYRPEDVDLLRRIRNLLYQDGYTIKGVQKLLREGGVKPVAADADTLSSESMTAETAGQASPDFLAQGAVSAGPAGVESQPLAETADSSAAAGVVTLDRADSPVVSPVRDDQAAVTVEESHSNTHSMGQGLAQSAAVAAVAPAAEAVVGTLSDQQREELQAIREELQALSDQLKNA